MPFISLKNISKEFIPRSKTGSPRQKVLQNITLAIEKGEFITFLGPSGCGKTTLLRIMSGLDREFSGSVEIEDKKITKRQQKRFGFVFQDSNLLPWKNIGENVNFFCELLRRKCDIGQIMETVGLSGYEKNYPHEVSGGMQKRAALARALSIQPEILFMDEPFGSLDKFTKQKMCLLLHELWKKFKMTILFVTHDMEEAVYLSDKVVTLSGHPTTIRSVHDVSQIQRNKKDPLQASDFSEISGRIYNDFIL